MEENKQSNALVLSGSGGALVAVPEKKPKYYTRVAGTYRLVFRILLIAIVLFTVLFSCFFYHVFSYESLFYFVKDISGLAGVDENAAPVYYTYHDGEAAFAAYHGGIARVSTAGVEIFSADGTRDLFAEHDLRAPRVAASRKYVIAYDHGGRDFYICNSYAELHHGVTDAPILGVYPSDAGEFALLTTSEKTLSAVVLYNSDFSQLGRFERAYATTGVSFAENGKRIALFGLEVKNGKSVSVLDVYEPGDTEPLFSNTFEGETPQRADFLGSKHLMLLTDAAVTFVGMDGSVQSVTPLDGREIVALDVNADHAAVVLEKGNFPAESRVLIFDKKGNVLLDQTISAAPADASLGDGALFLHAGSEVIRLTFTGEERRLVCPLDVAAVFAVSDTRVAVVRAAMTEYLSFEEG